MKRVFMFLFALAMVLGFYGQGHAALVDLGPDSLGYHMVYDTDLDLTWYDYTRNYDTWQHQVDWAASLTVNLNGIDYSGWRLPSTVDGPFVFGYDGTTTAGFNITSSEMGHLFYIELGNKGYYDISGNYVGDGNWGLLNTGPFRTLRPYAGWSSTEYAADPAYVWGFQFNTGYQSVGLKDGTEYVALAVRPDAPIAVPEPGTVLLLGSALIGLIARGKMFRRQG